MKLEEYKSRLVLDGLDEQGKTLPLDKEKENIENKNFPLPNLCKEKEQNIQENYKITPMKICVSNNSPSSENMDLISHFDRLEVKNNVTPVIKRLEVKKMTPGISTRLFFPPNSNYQKNIANKSPRFESYQLKYSPFQQRNKRYLSVKLNQHQPFGYDLSPEKSEPVQGAIDFIYMLPNEIILKIYYYLDNSHDLCCVSCVNKLSNFIADDPILWKSLYHINWPLPLEEMDWKKAFLKKRSELQTTKTQTYAKKLRGKTGTYSKLIMQENEMLNNNRKFNNMVSIVEINRKEEEKRNRKEKEQIEKSKLNDDLFFKLIEKKFDYFKKIDNERLQIIQ